MISVENQRERERERERESVTISFRNPLAAACDDGTFRPASELEKREIAQKEHYEKQEGVRIHPHFRITTPLAAIFESDMFFRLSRIFFRFFFFFRNSMRENSRRLSEKEQQEKKNTRKGKRPNTVREPSHLKESEQQSAPRQARGQMGHQKRAAGTNAGEWSGC